MTTSLPAAVNRLLRKRVSYAWKARITSCRMAMLPTSALTSKKGKYATNTDIKKAGSSTLSAFFYRFILLQKVLPTFRRQPPVQPGYVRRVLSVPWPFPVCLVFRLIQLEFVHLDRRFELGNLHLYLFQLPRRAVGLGLFRRRRVPLRFRFFLRCLCLRSCRHSPLPVLLLFGSQFFCFPFFFPGNTCSCPNIRAAA